MGRPFRHTARTISANPQNRERRGCAWFCKWAFAAATFSHPVLGKSRPALPTGPKPLFASDDVLSLTLTGPFDTISPAPTQSPPSRSPGVLKVAARAPRNHARDLVGLRGITRRKKEVCAFPPLPRGVLAKTRTVFHLQGTEAAQAGDPLPGAARITSNILLLEYTAYRPVPRPDPGKLSTSELARLTIPIRDGQALIHNGSAFLLRMSMDVVKRKRAGNGLRGLRRISASQTGCGRRGAAMRCLEYMISNLDWAMTAGPAGRGLLPQCRPDGCQGRDRRIDGPDPRGLMTLTMPGLVNAGPYGRAARTDSLSLQCESAALSRLLLRAA